MTKKRIVIVEPMGVAENVFSNSMSLPLMGTLYLGTILRDAGHDVSVINENIMKRAVNSVDLDADICCVSALTPTAERAYSILRQYRAIRPDGLTIIGGVHASFMSDEAAEYADYVVTGESEKILLTLIDRGFKEKVVKGELIANLDDIPLPDYKVIQQWQRIKPAPIMTSRGCPFDCTFCSVTKMFGRKYRTHSIERVMEEIKRVQQQEVFFYDDNFAANPLRLRELLERMLSIKTKFLWSAQVRSDVAKDPELIALMAKAKCKRVYIGFESIDDKNLEKFNKKQKRADIVAALNTFHKYGIAVHGMFILGADDDQPNAARSIVQFCKEHRMDSGQFMLLTPFPGTPLYSTMQRDGRLLHRKWSFYDSMHVVFAPKNETLPQLQWQMIKSHAEFYSLKGILTDFRRLLAGEWPRTLHRALDNSIKKIWAQLIIRRWLRVNKAYLAKL